MAYLQSSYFLRGYTSLISLEKIVKYAIIEENPVKIERDMVGGGDLKMRSGGQYDERLVRIGGDF
jgi:hypothetical protein